jgi:hypothetical protein
MSLAHRQNAYTQCNTCINYHLFSYMFWRLLRHLQGEPFRMLKSIVTSCEYMGVQLLYSYLKMHVCFNVELNMLKCLCKTL